MISNHTSNEDSTKNLMAVFPGQGSQKVGMGADLLRQFPYIREIFEEAEDASKLPIRSLCFEGPADKLQKTSHLQPCLLTLSWATWLILKKEIGFSARYFAGHSLGEYSALCASGRLDFFSAVQTVLKRGLAMEKACFGDQKAGMAAILGGHGETLQVLCQEAFDQGIGVCDVANWNSPSQHILSGHFSAIEWILSRLESPIKGKFLPVSAPFHSRLMKEARKEMEPVIRKLDFHQEPKSWIIPNVSGELCQHYAMDDLIAQIDSPVLWEKSMKSAYDAGVRSFVEVGPGRVLFGLARQCLGKDIQIAHTHELRDVIDLISKGHES